MIFFLFQVIWGLKSIIQSRKEAKIWPHYIIAFICQLIFYSLNWLIAGWVKQSVMMGCWSITSTGVLNNVNFFRSSSTGLLAQQHWSDCSAIHRQWRLIPLTRWKSAGNFNFWSATNYQAQMTYLLTFLKMVATFWLWNWLNYLQRYGN